MSEESIILQEANEIADRLMENLRKLHEGRDAPLYHTTYYLGALQIVIDDALFARTLNPIGDKLVKGVSLSRDRNLALGGRLSIKGTTLLKYPVTFELNQRRLAQNYKILPLDFFATSDAFPPDFTGFRQGQLTEAEEFVLSDIAPLSRYLLAIHIPQQTLDLIVDDPEFEPLLVASRMLTPA